MPDSLHVKIIGLDVVEPEILQLLKLGKLQRTSCVCDHKLNKPKEPALKELPEKMAKLRERMLESTLDSMDAATLYSKWYMGGPDGLVPCTAIRGGPADLNEPDIQV